MKTLLNTVFEESLKSNWNINAFSDYEGQTYTYKEVAHNMLRFHAMLQAANVQQGDKVILLGRNSANWATTYLSLITYGAVVVPVLPDFTNDDFYYIFNHSEAEFLFISETIYKDLDKNNLGSIKGAISLNSFQVLKDNNTKTLSKFLQKYDADSASHNTTPENIAFSKIENSALGILSYTSGTTGFSKGVMISRNSLISNITFARDHMPLKSGDTICSFLPLAHIYGQLFEFLFPFSLGCHITFLNKMPSPTVLTKAFGEIKPDLILSVPLIIEKIYKKKLVPVISRPLMKIALAVPGLNLLIRKKINDQLTNSFGGKFFEMVVGGAAINAEVEQFLRKIKFRYTVGYGMTECGPLISYASTRELKLSSAGKLVDRMQVRIDSSDPYNEIGEIQVKGENVMMGYYKDEKATEDSFTEDGWLRTGDLGIIDRENFIFIKGRSKNMLLGANGKNIYPEEIEARLNQLPIILECVVVSRNDKLTALIYPDPDFLKTEGIETEELPAALEDARKTLNKSLPKYMQIVKFELQHKEFEKTPKKNIKRFKYH